jgi:hypothetical protein
MVPHGEMIIIRLQRILWPAVHCPDSERVVSPGIEVRVVADEHWHVHCYIPAGVECALADHGIVFEEVGTGGVF